MINHPSMPHFLASEISPPEPGKALFHIIPAPFERSVSYGKGTAGGPAAILESSSQLELFDGVSIPAEHGIFTAPAIDCEGAVEDVLKRITDAVSGVLKINKIPVVLGGEHTVSVGAFTALKKFFRDFGIVQFDAHADLRDTYEGTPFSHACVMRRALDMGIPIFQIGVRSLSFEEHQLRAERKIGQLDAATIHRAEVPDPILPPNFPKNIYITFDVDSLDPSIMPATGTPEPGGLTWTQTFAALESIVSGRHVIGLDVVELAPIAGLHSPEFTMARFIYNLLGLITRKRNSN
jgi:agmatinase